MALGDPYVTLNELKQYLGIALNEDSKDEQLQFALDSATSEIEEHCERQFNKADAASPRIYTPMHRALVDVDDFYTTTDLVVETDDSYDGSYGQTWTTADYALYPPNGVVSGQPNWPYWQIEAVRALRFPIACLGRPRLTVRVTAKWGWPAVPKTIRQACFQMAAQNYKMADAPLGVAGFGEFGVVRVRDIPALQRKLCRFKRDAVEVG